MRAFIALIILLTANWSTAANEERFEWMGIDFCHTTVGEVIELFPNAKYFDSFEILAAKSSGETLGAVYDELFFLVSPDGVIVGLNVPIASGDIEAIIQEIDVLAAERWTGEVHKERLLPTSTTWSSSGLGVGRDVHMHLDAGQTSLLYNIGHSTDRKKRSVIAFTSITGCDRALRSTK